MWVAPLIFAIFVSIPAYAADCDTFVVQHAGGVYSNESSLVNEATSLTPFSTRYVNRVSYQSVFPSGPKLDLDCSDGSNLDKATAQRLRSAVYWVTKAASYFRARIKETTGKDFNPSQIDIVVAKSIADADLKETYPASAEQFWGPDDQRQTLRVGISDLSNGDIAPEFIVHEYFHILHRRYRQFLRLPVSNSSWSRTFGEAIADFFAMRVAQSDRLEYNLSENGAQLYLVRKFSDQNRFPADQVTQFDYLKPIGNYLLGLFREDLYPLKHADLKAQIDAAATQPQATDLSDLRSWYWYIGGLIINQSLYRVIQNDPISAVAIERAYVRLMETLPAENWDGMAKMTKDDANAALMKTFHYPPNFARAFAEAIDDKMLREKVTQEFSYVIQDGVPEKLSKPIGKGGL